MKSEKQQRSPPAREKSLIHSSWGAHPVLLEWMGVVSTAENPGRPRPVSRARVCFFVGLLSIVSLTLLFWVTDLDLRGPALTYSPVHPHWPLAKHWLPKLAYKYGAWPGLALAGSAVLLGVGSMIHPALRSFGKPCLFLIALTTLVPGLLINGVFKPLMGRPRPYETVNFGGVEPFVRPFEPGKPFHGSSFISGHASMAFLILGLFFITEGWKRWAALIGGLVWGLFVGSARVLQGDHYPSDVLLAGAFDFSVAAALSMLLSWGTSPGKR